MTAKVGPPGDPTFTKMEEDWEDVSFPNPPASGLPLSAVGDSIGPTQAPDPIQKLVLDGPQQQHSSRSVADSTPLCVPSSASGGSDSAPPQQLQRRNTPPHASLGGNGTSADRDVKLDVNADREPLNKKVKSSLGDFFVACCAQFCKVFSCKQKQKDKN